MEQGRMDLAQEQAVAGGFAMDILVPEFQTVGLDAVLDVVDGRIGK